MSSNKIDNLTENKAQIIPFIQNGDYFYHKGIIAYRKKEFHKAVLFLEKAIELNKDNASFHCQLAAILAEDGKYEKSNEILKAIIASLDKDMNECYFFMANNYAHLGLFDKAEEMANYYITRCPEGEFYQDTCTLLELLQFEKDDDEWEGFGEEEMLIIRHDKACTFLENCQYDLAINEFNEIIKENPTFWAAYNHLAEAYFLLGDTKKAIELLYDVLQQDKDNLMALCYLASFYHQLNRQDEVAELIKGLKKVWPLDLDHRFTLATTLCQLGAYEESYQHFNYLQKYYDDKGSDFYRCFGIVAYRCGSFHKGMHYWRKAARLGDKKSEHLLKLYESGVLTVEDVVYTV